MVRLLWTGHVSDCISPVGPRSLRPCAALFGAQSGGYRHNALATAHLAGRFRATPREHDADVTQRHS